MQVPYPARTGLTHSSYYPNTFSFVLSANGLLVRVLHLMWNISGGATMYVSMVTWFHRFCTRAVWFRLVSCYFRSMIVCKRLVVCATESPAISCINTRGEACLTGYGLIPPSQEESVKINIWVTVSQVVRSGIPRVLGYNKQAAEISRWREIYNHDCCTYITIQRGDDDDLAG